MSEAVTIEVPATPATSQAFTIASVSDLLRRFFNSPKELFTISIMLVFMNSKNSPSTISCVRSDSSSAILSLPYTLMLRTVMPLKARRFFFAVILITQPFSRYRKENVVHVSFYEFIVLYVAVFFQQGGSLLAAFHRYPVAVQMILKAQPVFA